MTKGTNSLYSLRGTSPSSKHLPCSQKLSLLSARSLLIQGGVNKDNFWGYCTPRPQIGRSSKSTPQHNKQSKPKAKFAFGLLLGWPLPWPQKCPYSPDSRHLVWGCTRATNWCAFAASSNWWLWCHPKKGVLNQVNKDNCGWPWQGLAKKQAQSQFGFGLAFLLCIGVLLLLLPIGGSGATPETVS